MEDSYTITVALACVAIVASVYLAFCWGVDWARYSTDRRARADHVEAIRERDIAREALQAHEAECHPDEDEYRRLLADLRRAEAFVLRRVGAADTAYCETQTWITLLPWIEKGSVQRILKRR